MIRAKVKNNKTTKQERRYKITRWVLKFWVVSNEAITENIKKSEEASQVDTWKRSIPITQTATQRL